MKIGDVIALRKTKKIIKKRKILIDKYFKNIPDDKWADEVMLKFDLLKYIFRKYPIIIDQAHACILELFRIENRDIIEINGETLNKEKEIEEYNNIIEEIKSFEHSLKQTK